MNGEFGNINIQTDTETTFLFSFVDSNTDAPIVIEAFLFSFFDLDEGNNGNAKETLGIAGFEEYTVTDNTQLVIDEAADFATMMSTFTSSVQTQQMDNPNDPNNLTSNQEDKSVTFLFKNLSEFTVHFSVTPADGNVQGRNFLFAGVSSIILSPPPP